MKNLISIIVPVYNVKGLIGRCLMSLIRQTYKNIEIIVIDDGSTDGSSLECDKYVDVDSRIKVYHKNNGGLSNARNFGMNFANGDYYLFIDSDDMVHEKFCEVLIEKALKYDAEVVSTDIIAFWNDIEIEKYNNSDIKYEIVIERGKILKEYFMPKDKRIINHGLCMKLYKRDLFDNLLFEEGRLHEDLFITHKILKKCNRFVYIEVPYYYYYQQNDNSISNNYREKNFYDECDCVEQIYLTYINEPELKDDVIGFCVYHYLFMLEKIGNTTNNKINIKKRIIKKWVATNIWRNNSLSLMKKNKIIFGTVFTNTYFMLRRKKHEI